MKRSSTVAAILACAMVLCGWSQGQGARRIDFTVGQGGEASGISIVDAGNRSTRLRVGFDGMSCSVEGSPEGEFTRIRIADSGVLYTPGKPEIPVLRKLIEVTRGSEVELEVLATDWFDLDLRDEGLPERILPVQESTAKEPFATRTFTVDNAFYRQRDFYPATSAKITDLVMIRGRTFATLEIYPVQYDPTAGVLRCSRSIEIEITDSGGSPQSGIADIERLRSDRFDRFLEDRVVDRDTPFFPPPPEGGDPDAGVEGIIMVGPGTLLEPMDEYIQWRRRSGHRVETIDTLETGSTNEWIKALLQNAFDTWADPPLTAVILVGDLAQVPTFDGETQNHTADLYYACLSGDDYVPDLWLGRISVTNAEEAQNVAERILDYDRGAFPQTDWIKRASFIATDDLGYYRIAEGSHNYCTTQYMDPAGYASDHLYAISTDATSTDVTGAINAGRSLIAYSGHGSVTSWMGPQLEGAEVETLSLGERAPIVMSFACVTAAINVTECFGETWLRKQAAAFWGASDSTYWDEDDVLERGAFEAVYDMGIVSLGGMATEALARVYDYYGGQGRTHYYYEVYHILGDPTLKIRTEEPRTLQVEHTGVLAPGSGAYSLSIYDGLEPVSGALVSLIKADENIRAVGRTDAYGMVDVVFDPPPALEGEIDIVVTRHNYLPYEGRCTLVDPVGPYLVHHDHLFDDSQGNSDGMPNPGEEVVMTVDVENLGDDEGFECSGTLSTQEEGISLIEDYASFPAISGKAISTSAAPHFRWSSAEGTTDGTRVRFTLAWNCSGGYSGETAFSVFVCNNLDGDGFSSCTGDCDDLDPTIHPDGYEVCDGADNDCDGEVDEGYDDFDLDNVADCIDCDDSDPSIFPGAPEACDGLDNDCDGFTGNDEVDGDNDGWMICAGDCDDGDGAINPGRPEVPGNGFDDNCNGGIDEAPLCGTLLTGKSAGTSSALMTMLILLLVPAATLRLLRRTLA